jgi:hypothetical protein
VRRRTTAELLQLAARVGSRLLYTVQTALLCSAPSPSGGRCTTATSHSVIGVLNDTSMHVSGIRVPTAAAAAAVAAPPPPGGVAMEMPAADTMPPHGIYANVHLVQEHFVRPSISYRFRFH